MTSFAEHAETVRAALLEFFADADARGQADGGIYGRLEAALLSLAKMAHLYKEATLPTIEHIQSIYGEARERERAERSERYVALLRRIAERGEAAAESGEKEGE